MMKFGTASKLLATGAAAVAAIAIFCGQASATNDILAQWFMEANAGPTAGPFSNDGAGTGTALGFHTGASTYSIPAGNGSTHSFSSNTWAIGDYYQFQTSSLGATGIGLQFDQVSSNTGPGTFQIQYSTDGTTFANLASGAYTVQQNASPSWSSNASFPVLSDTYNFDLSSISALDNAANVYFRLTDTSTNSANFGTVAIAGTDRVDNVSIYNNYDPTMAPVPQLAPTTLPVAGNIAFATNTVRNRITLELLNGQTTPTLAGGAKAGFYSPWTATQFVNFVKFDNLGGTAHNAQGNLLGLNSGSTTSGSQIYNFATKGSIPAPAGQVIGNTTGTGGSGLTLSRLTGLSVSPDNTKIAVAAADTGHVIVYDYSAGNSLGSGASLSGGRQTTSPPLAPAIGTGSTAIAQNQGTAWLNNSTVLAFSTTGNLYQVDATSMAAALVASVTTPHIGENSTALAYNPGVSKYVYAMYGGFVTGGLPTATQNQLYIFDPTNAYSLVKTLNLNTETDLDPTTLLPTVKNSPTARDIALDKNGNLFIAGNQSKISVLADVVSNPAALTDNSAVGWYTSDASPFSPTFSGLDIGFAPAATGVAGDYNSDGVVDAADYAIWRAHEGQTFQLAHEDPGSTPGTVTIEDYNYWKAHFGATAPGSGALGSGAVPEPGSIALLAIGLVGLFAGRRRFGR